MDATINGTTGRKDANRVAMAATVGNMVSITPAISATFGIFLVPITEEFGWLRSTASGVLTVIAVISFLVYPLVGRLADRVGPRRILVLGNLLFAPAIALLALATGSVWQFYLLFVLIGLTGALPSTVMFSKIVSDWFDERRGLMLGLTAGVGNGVGATMMPILAGTALTLASWRVGFLSIGIAVFLLGFPVLFFLLRDAPRHGVAGHEHTAVLTGMSLREALRTRAFWLVLVAIAASAGAMTALFTHVVPVLGDRGIDLTLATTVISVFAMVTAIWQVATGAALDRIRSPLVIVPMYALAIAGIWLLQSVHSTPLLILAGAMLGIGMGAEYGALPYFISRYFGLKNYGAIAGAIYGVVILAQGLGPFLMDIGYDLSGSYHTALIITGLVLVVGMILVAILPPFHAVEHDKTEAGEPPLAVPVIGK